MPVAGSSRRRKVARGLIRVDNSRPLSIAVMITVDMVAVDGSGDRPRAAGETVRVEHARRGGLETRVDQSESSTCGVSHIAAKI
jgi:hypothetical protein